MSLAATPVSATSLARTSVFGAPRRLGHAEAAVGVFAFAAAALAIWLTLRAAFLQYPGWLAAQKADLILGPVLVGLYWRRVRPRSRFAWILIGYGVVNAAYIAQSSSRPWLFGLGLVAESLVYLGNQLLILTFPTGRLDGIAAKVLLLGSVANAVFNIWLIVMLPETGAGGAISRCESACPRNGLAFAPNVSRALDLLKPFQYAVIAVSVGTACLLLWRMATGSPPRRRALAIGTSVALAFLGMQVAYLLLSVLGANATELMTALQWAYTGARAGIWYGFLFALIAAQLFAWRALRALVLASLQRPSQRRLETMLREPLGDPSLQLRFWDAEADRWDGGVEPGAGSVTTFVEREGHPSVALIHDAQLADDPELLQAAGAVALLAAENAELDTGWSNALTNLRRSRARLVEAVDEERHRLALDLHDRVQPLLGAVRISLAAAGIRVPEPNEQARFTTMGERLDEAIEELREVSHQLYPRPLLEQGLVEALTTALEPVRLDHDTIGSHSKEAESAIYHCVLEAVQNSRKHGGAAVTITAKLRGEDGRLSFEVADDGPGFDPTGAHDGMGLQSLHDRVGALDGELVIESRPGRTVVSGYVPDGSPQGARTPR